MLTATSEKDYGLFWEIDRAFEYGGEELLLMGHDGSAPGAFPYIYFDPAQHIGIVIVANGDDDGVDEQSIEDLVAWLFESGELLQQP